jgi:hypothetical protein
MSPVFEHRLTEPWGDPRTIPRSAALAEAMREGWGGPPGDTHAPAVDAWGPR